VADIDAVFKAYDIRGEIGVNIDEGVAYCIGRAVAQHFSAKSVVGNMYAVVHAYGTMPGGTKPGVAVLKTR
jgi:phosphomannomutase